VIQVVNKRFYKIGAVGVTDIPKSGSQTVEAIADVVMDDSSLCQVSNLIAFIREPIDRLKSLYKFQRYVYHLAEQPIRCWNCFIEWVLETDEIHAKPQADFLFGTETLYKLEEMDSVLQRLTGTVVERKNQTAMAVPYTDYRIDDIRDKYQADMKLYAGL